MSTFVFYKQKYMNKLAWDYLGWTKVGLIANPYDQDDWNQTILTKFNQLVEDVDTNSHFIVSKNLEPFINNLLMKHLHTYDFILEEDNLITFNDRSLEVLNYNKTS